MIRLTPEYVGGVLGGMGFGAVFIYWIVAQGFVELFPSGIHPFVLIPGFLFIAVGGSLARASQRRQRNSESSSGA